MRPPPQIADDELRRWLNELWLYVSGGVKILYNQNDEPSIADNTTALWIDADGGPAYYLIANFDGTQKKVALT